MAAKKKKKKKQVMDQFGASSLRTIRFSSSIVILSRIFLRLIRRVYRAISSSPNFFHDVHSICRRHNVGLLYTPNNLRVRFLLLEFNGQKGFKKRVKGHSKGPKGERDTERTKAYISELKKKKRREEEEVCMQMRSGV